MLSNRAIATVLLTCAIAPSAFGVSIRYFLSPTGLSDPNDDQSFAVAPQSTIFDPVIYDPFPPVSRLYLWADITPTNISPLTDVTSIDLMISANRMRILRTNIWNRTLDDNGTPTDPSDDIQRWDSAPGLQDWSSSPTDFVVLAPATAVTARGLTTRLATLFLDNQDRPGGLWLFGWIEVQPDYGGTIQIHSNYTRFLQGDFETNRTYIGNDDNVGGPAEVPGSYLAYTNGSWEALAVPEPTTLALMSLAMLFIRRR